MLRFEIRYLKTRDLRAKLEASRKLSAQAVSIEPAVFEGAFVVLEGTFDGRVIGVEHELLCVNAWCEYCA